MLESKERLNHITPNPTLQPTPELTLHRTGEFKEVEYPSTISKSWIPLIQMMEVYTFNSKFAKSVRHLLENKFIVGWKKVRGDGNCYYSAVILKFIENIHKPYKSTDQLSSFYQLLKSLNQITFPDSNYKQAYKEMRTFIKRSISRKKINNEHVQTYIDTLELLQDKRFCEICVRISRMVTLKSFSNRFSTGELSFFMSKSEAEYVKDIITMGIEAEDLTLLILPTALGTQVVQFNIFDDNIYEQVIPEGEKHEDQIIIVRRSGHYDLLYSRKEQELDQYCFLNKSYFIL